MVPFFFGRFNEYSKATLKAYIFVNKTPKPGNSMKIKLILLIFLTSSLILSGQESLSSLRIKRDSLLEAYFKHRDTVTVRTWINVITSNKYLEEIRITDSVLMSGGNQSVEKSYQMINELQDENSKLIIENREMNDKYKALKDNTSFENTTFLFSILVACIFLILFVVLFFGYSAARRNAKIREVESRNYLAELNDARDEIEKMQNSENDLAHKLNLMESENHEKLRSLLAVKSTLEDEKLLLENQIIEVKKAYDHEVLKRMETESELVLAQQQGRLNITAVNEQQKIIDLEEKLKLLELENGELNSVLNKTLVALESEVNFRKGAEESLNSIVTKLETAGFLKPGNRDLLHVKDEIKAYEQLLIENKSLADELEKARLKYSHEIKIRLQLQNDLDMLLSRLKGDFTG